MDPLIEDNLSCLDQGISLLEQLPAEIFTQACPTCFNSTIGGHIRHNTDHYEQFLGGYDEGVINYDARSRDLRVETEIALALSLMRSLRASLSSVSAGALDRSLRVCMDGGGATTWTESSVRRELQFLISHTIHHYALIVAIAQAFGFDQLPAEFGMAPSTLKHRATQA